MVKPKFKFLAIGLLLLLSLAVPLSSLVVGSDTAVSRQAAILFPSADTDNSILGFAWMDNGFTLSNGETTCTFNSVFPVVGDVYFNAGLLYLNRDLKFERNSRLMNAGSIYGYTHAVRFSSDTTEITNPSGVGAQVFNVLGRYTTANTINEVSWSYDNQYVAFVDANNNLRVLSFNGSSLSLLATAGLGRQGYCVEWHPSQYSIAVGLATGFGNDVVIYSFTPPSTLTLTGGANPGTNVYSVGWAKSGTYLAVGAQTGTKVRIYPFSGGTLGTAINGNVQPTGNLSLRAMDWNAAGSYLAVGAVTSAGTELLLYYWSGTTLTLTVSGEIGADVSAIDWSPTSSLIAVGLSGGSERLRVYNHNVDDGTLLEQTSARVGEASTVNCCDWHPSGTSLLVSRAVASGSEFRDYSFFSTTTTFSIIYQIESNNAINSARWSRNDGLYWARGDSTVAFLVGEMAASFVLDNVSLFFDSNVTLKTPLTVSGNCSINTGGYALSIAPQGSITIRDGATLTIEGSTIITQNSFPFTPNTETSKLVLRNSALRMENELFWPQGNIGIINEANITGAYAFHYQSLVSSTIDAFSLFQCSDGAILDFECATTDNNQPLLFTDTTSSLVLQNATLQVSGSGLKLTKGVIEIDGASTFSISSFDPTYALSLGDGTVAGDVVLNIDSGSVLTVANGAWLNTQVSPDCIHYTNETSGIVLGNASATYFGAPFNVQYGSITAQPQAGITFLPGAYIKATDFRVVRTSDYRLTGTVTSVLGITLDKNDTIDLLGGTFQNLVTVSRDGNSITGFAAVRSNITLLDQNSTLTWGSTAKIYKFSMIPALGQNMLLNGGKLVFDVDASFGADYGIIDYGTIDLQDHEVDFGPLDSTRTGTFLIIGNNGKIQINATTSLSGTWTFSGTVELNGADNEFTLLPGSNIVVGEGSVLKLKNINLQGITGNNIQCMDNTSQLILDNVRWVQTGDYTFTMGSVLFQNNVECVGTYTFAYQSNQTSTIQNYSSLIISDNMRFEIGRKEITNFVEPLYFADTTAELMLRGCTFVTTATGMQILHGTVGIDKSVTMEFMSTNPTYAFIMGDGTLANDVVLAVESGAQLSLVGGAIVDNITDPTFFSMPLVRGATLVQEASNTFYFNQDVALGNLVIQGVEGNVVSAPGKTLFYNNCLITIPGITEFFLTGYGTNEVGIYYLTGNGEMNLISGDLPVYAAVSGTGNIIRGVGNMTGAVILQDSASELTWGLNGFMMKDIALSGGTILYNSDLKFSHESKITGSGIVNFDGDAVIFGPVDSTRTGTFFIISDNGGMQFNAKVSLAGTWTFSGRVTIDGKTNTFELLPSGGVVIDHGTSVKIKNMTITGIMGNNIRCLGDDSQLILENVLWQQTGDYTFTVGSILFQNMVDMVGAYTFAYQSNQTSTINSFSSLTISDDMRFEIGRKEISDFVEPLYFEDTTAQLMLRNCSLVTTESGMRLTHGTLSIDKDVVMETMSSNPTYGLIFGDGTAPNDIVLDVQPGSLVYFSGGAVSENITNPAFWSMGVEKGATFVQHAASALYLNQDTLLKNLVIDLTEGNVIVASGKTLAYDHCYMSLPGVTEFFITGTASNENGIFYLIGNGEINLTSGVLPVVAAVSGTGNVLRGIGNMQGGVVLQDSASELTWGLNGFVQNNIDLNGGTFIAASNLNFAEDYKLTGSGVINLGIYSVYRGALETTSTSTLQWNAYGGQLQLNAKNTLSGTWTLSGVMQVAGNGNILEFLPSGKLIIASGATVTLKDMTLQGITDNNIQCADNTSQLILDNVRWIQTGNYTFTEGSILFQNNVELIGSYTFAYQSNQTSTINNFSSLMISDNMRFEIGRKEITNFVEPLYFEDTTAELMLRGCTFAITDTGMQMLHGTLGIDKNVIMEIMSTNPTYGFIMGDGTVANDLVINLQPGAALNLSGGSIVDNITNASFLSMPISQGASLNQHASNTIYINQDASLGNLVVDASQGNVVIAPGKTLFYNNCLLTIPGVTEFFLTGYGVEDPTVYYLTGNGEMNLISGELPVYAAVSGNGNVIRGIGNMTGQVIYQNENAELTWGLNGFMMNNIVLNGGTIIFDTDLKFAKDYKITGSGIVNFDGDAVIFGPVDSTRTGTFFIISDNGKMELNANVSLAGTWTFSGLVTIEGNNNTFELLPSGNIVIDSGAMVRIRNVSMRGIADNNIRCIDDSSQLILENIGWVQTGNYTFTKGSILFQNNVELVGTYTFAYQSNQTSTINNFSSLTISDNMRFEIGRKEISNFVEPLYFADTTAGLMLRGCTFVTTGTGLQFLHGTLGIDKSVVLETMSTNPTYGFILGDGSVPNDVVFDLQPGSMLNLRGGAIVDNITDAEFLSMPMEQGASLIQEVSNTIYMNQDVRLVNLIVDVTDGTVAITTGKNLFYDNCLVRIPGISEFYLTAYGTNDMGVFNLSGNGAVSLQSGVLPIYTLVSGVGNSINGIGDMSGGVILQDYSTTLSWGLSGDLTNNIALNGGYIYLNSSLNLAQDYIVSGSGTVNLNSKNLSLGAKESAWTENLYFEGNVGFITLNANIALNGQWTFSNDIVIDGNGCRLELGATGSLIVEQGSTLELRNIRIENIVGENIKCLDDAGIIKLQNAQLDLSGDSVFTHGAFIFDGENSICTEYINSGFYTFSYESNQTSSILDDGNLCIGENIRFAIGNKNADATSQVLEFKGLKARLCLDGGLLNITHSGMKLKTGTLLCSSGAWLDIDPVYGLTFGDGINANNDFTLKLDAGATATISNGPLYYNNVMGDKIKFVDSLSKIRLEVPSGIVALQGNVLFSDGTLNISSAVLLTPQNGALFTLKNMTVYRDDPYSKMVITDKIYPSGFYYGSDSLLKINEGTTLPSLQYRYYEDGGQIGGAGLFASSLILADENTNVYASFGTPVAGSVIMNGGQVTLNNDFAFSNSGLLTGSGTVNALSSYRFAFASTEQMLTHTILWNGNVALNLNAQTSLAGTWTFSGTESICGNGNILDLSNAGSIVVDNDSTVYLTDVYVKGLGSGQGSLGFMNKNSQVHLANVTIELASNYSMTTGGIYVDGPTTFILNDYDLNFDQQASLTVDGVTLWIDPLDKSSSGNITFGVPVENYLTLLNSGTIKVVGSAGEISALSAHLTATMDQAYGVIDNIQVQLSYMDSTTGNININGDSLMLYDIYIAPNHRLDFGNDALLNGSTHYIYFSDSDAPILTVDAGKTVTLQNVVLKNFAERKISLGVGAALIFGEHTVLEFDTNESLASTWTCTGVVTLNGESNQITLVGLGGLYVDAGSQLLVQNARLSGLESQNLLCADDSASIIFRSCDLIFTDTFNFTKGSIFFDHDVNMVGTQVFCYQSSQASTVAQFAKLIFEDGFTFSYDPAIPSKDLLIFQDQSATLEMAGGSLHVTETGLTLKNGALVIDRHSYFSADGVGQIDLGDNVVASNDMFVAFRDGAVMDVVAGALAYKNIDRASWIIPDPATLYIRGVSTLNLYQTIPHANTFLHFADYATLNVAAGANIEGSIGAEGQITYGTLP